MSPYATSFLTAALLVSAPLAVSAAVHAAVIFTRTGERTPLLVQQHGPPELTPLGARQAHSQGTVFRQRYIAPEANGVDLEGPEAIRNISEYGIDNNQLYVLATDDGYATETAQAFLQGLYPPYTLNDTVPPTLTANAVLANGTYMEAPLNGYQYPRIRTASSLDPAYVYLDGQKECLNYALDRTSYYYTLEFNETQARTSSFYGEVGAATLGGILPAASYSYANAYAIYDYLNYQYLHNISIQAILSNNITLRALKMLRQLAINIATDGAQAKLSLLFGEFQPMLSFFALALQQSSNSSRSYGIPDFASSMAFELFSYGDATEGYPATSDLWVRFYFRNGTSDSSELVAYPIFGHGPSETAMRWSDFETSMRDIMLDGVGECDADVSFATKGAPLGVSVTEEQQQKQQSGLARERVGSWEMGGAKANQLGGSVVGDWKDDESRRSSLDIYESAVARPHSRL
ncbi:putative histidine acid [Diplodia seriata]|uniref:Putative histidine acid n=1 Tax=Diplodia seriata TaxID=420778 RepID=A0A0G2EMT2_9PEZI|nr:putative histidine acid [Diplodia seriata]